MSNYQFQIILTDKAGKDHPSVSIEVSNKMSEAWAIKQAQVYFRSWVIRNKKSTYGWRIRTINHPKYGKLIDPDTNKFEFKLDNHGLRHEM